MNNATPQPTADLDAGLANLRAYGYTIHPGFIDGHRLVQLRERLLAQADMQHELGLANGGLSISDPIGTGSELSPVQLVVLLPNKGRVFVDLFNRAQGRHATQHQPLDSVHPRTAPGLGTLAGRDRQARRRLPLTVQRH